MKLFLDTASVAEIKEAVGWGAIDGITTNPSLAAKEKREFKPLIKEICRLVQGPVSAEVVSTDVRGMIKEGTELAALDEHVVVKVPLTPDGLKACRELTRAGHDVNVTLCFSASQGLLAMKAGATYLSPFVGRLDDRSEDGMRLIADLVSIKENYGFETQVLVASVRHPRHVVDSALLGADVATIPFKILELLVKHPLTDQGLDAFVQDWKKSGLSL